MSPLEAEFLRNSAESGDQQYDLETNADAPREIVNQKVSPRAIEHGVIYRGGFYSALGISLTLVVLNIVGVRNAILNREPKPKTSESWSGTPLASLRFAVPAKGDLGTKIKFHFSGLGYELLDEPPGMWIFQRGTMMAVLGASDIRVYPTRLSVHTIQEEDGGHLVNCHWSVKLMGNWASKKDIRRLEDEGRELESLLTGGSSVSVATAIASTSVETAEAVAASLAADSESIAQSAAETIDEDASEKWIKPDASEFDMNAVEEEVNLPAVGMIVVGLVMAIAHFIAMVTILEDSQTVELMWLAVPGILVGIALLVGGIGLHGLRSRSCAQVGIVAGFMPVSPAFLFTIILSIAAMKALSKAEVKLAFRQRKNRHGDELTRRSIDSSQDERLDIVAIEEEVSGPAIAMIAVGLLTLVGLAAADVMILSNRSDPLLVWLSIPGLLVGLGMLMGGLNMKRLGSRSVAQMGAIAGMIPIHPA